MRFITEQELRVQYKKKKFAAFVIPCKTRLTPEAHQFLADRRITLTFAGEEPVEIMAVPDSSPNLSVPSRPSRAVRLLHLKFDTLEAVFFQVEIELEKLGHESLVKQIALLRQYVRNIIVAEKEKSPLVAIPVLAQKKAGVEVMGKRSVSVPMSSTGCLVLNQQILGQLHYVRTNLQEVAFTFEDVYETELSGNESLQKLCEAIEFVHTAVCLLIDNCPGGKA